MTLPTMRRTPWWVTALDVLCLVLVALLLRSLAGDRYRISLTPEIQLTMRSSWRLGLWLAGLLLLRHVAWRTEPWHVRVLGWIRSFVMWPPLGAAWTPFVTSRLAVLVVAYIAVFTVGFARPPVFRALDNDWLDLYARWDAGWYFGIASVGYPSAFNPAGQSSIAFFPGLPLVMRALRVLLDVNLWVAGILAVILAFLWALTYVYRLALQDDLSPDQARASVMFLAWYPFAVCYNAILTESLFLLAAAGAFYHFRRSERWKAGLFGLLAGLLRPNGCLLSIPLALVSLIAFARSRGWLPGARRGDVMGWPALAAQIAVASLPGIGMLAYSAYVNSRTGNPFAWAAAQQAWGRGTVAGFAVLNEWITFIGSQGLSAFLRGYAVWILEASAAFFALGAIWPIVRRFGLPYGAFVVISVLPPLITMGPISLGRYTAPLFPIFLWLGAAIPAERRPYWVAVFAAGQAVVAMLFFTWRPPY